MKADQQPNGGPGAYVPQSILPEDLEDDAPSGLDLEYQHPPIQALPAPLAEYVSASAEAIGCDPALVAMPALAAVAAAIGDSRAVEVKPGWQELAILWALVVAPSGALKTPAMKAALVGLEEAQKRAFEDYRLAEAQHKAKVAEWNKAGKVTAEPQPPALSSYYVGDATLEAVGALLDTNPRGLLQKRDELSGWLGGFNRSNEGDEAGQWLEFHSGNAVRIDRKGGDKKTIYIPRALVSVTGTIQEGILRKLLTGDDAKHFDNGLAARFLMAKPPERTRQWREASVAPELVDKYVALFRCLLTLQPAIDADTGRRTPIVLRWAPEAKARVVGFVNAHGEEMGAFKSDRLKSAWSKLEGQLPRLALVFHCIRHAYLPGPDGDARTISLETVEAALAWIEWLKQEVRRIYYTLAHAADVRMADKLMAFAHRNGGRCTARDAARAGAGGRTAEEVEKIMGSLVAAGLAAWAKPEQPKGGRPTRVFVVNSAKQAEPSRETDETS